MSIHTVALMNETPSYFLLAGQYGSKEPIPMAIRYSGRVVALREANLYDDSDFYAVVWDSETGEPREVLYATTRGWTYPNHASVDATAEIMAAYRSFQAEKAEQRRKAAEAAQAEEQAREAVAVRKGRRVVVARGRKVPKGTTGLCFWTGVDKWGKGRCGIETTDGTRIFTAVSNCDAISS